MGKEVAYRLIYNRPLLEFSGSPISSFREELRKSEYEPNQCPDNTLVYSYQEFSKKIVAGLSLDAQRSSKMLWETLIAIEKNKQKKSIAWKMVKFYYAAFFASQIISRLTNNWPCQLSGLDDFNELLQIYHSKRLSITTKTKTFLCRFDNPLQISCFPIEYADASSHGLTWKIFTLNLQKSISQLKSIKPQTSDISETIGELSKLIIDLGDNTPTFLSTYRNDLNYRLGQGVWFPQSKNASKEWKIYFNLMEIDRNISTPPSYIQRPNSNNQKFLSCCAFIIHLSLWMMRDFSTSNLKNKSFNGLDSLISHSLTE